MSNQRPDCRIPGPLIAQAGRVDPASGGTWACNGLPEDGRPPRGLPGTGPACSYSVALSATEYRASCFARIIVSDRPKPAPVQTAGCYMETAAELQITGDL